MGGWTHGDSDARTKRCREKLTEKHTNTLTKRDARLETKRTQGKMHRWTNGKQSSVYPIKGNEKTPKDRQTDRKSENQADS